MTDHTIVPLSKRVPFIYDHTSFVPRPAETKPENSPPSEDARDQGTIFTFYSYKGGVGRTMVLANIAELFYQAGAKVLMIDWDLEAPGLERFFFPPDEVKKVQNEAGIMDMLLDYKQVISSGKLRDVQPEPLPLPLPESYCQNIRQSATGGELRLITAGKRPNGQFDAYARRVLKFDWSDFIKNWEGIRYLEWVRRRLVNMADIILVDSRTGVTEIGGISTYLLADVVVMLCGANQQNLNGTRQMAEKFISKDVEKNRNGRRLETLVIPARLEKSEGQQFNKFGDAFKNIFVETLAKLSNKKLTALPNMGIPYIPYYAFDERLIDPDESIAQDILSPLRQLHSRMQIIHNSRKSKPLPANSGISDQYGVLEAVMKAVYASPQISSMFYLSGPGGVGKTRLLEEIGRRVEALPEYDCKWAGIIDLYHTEFHTPGGVRQAIVDALDPDNQHFQTYRQVRQEFEDKRNRGFSDQSIETLRQQLGETFRSDYAALAKDNCRVVLTFDTVEFMQYESDAVQEICRVEEEGTLVKNWLLEQVSQLPNTVMVLAGRPSRNVEARFVARYRESGWQAAVYHYQGLSLEATRAYLEEVSRQAPNVAEINQDRIVQEQLHQLSQGRPIYLAIILDLIRNDTIILGDIFETFPEEVGNKLVELYISLDHPWHEIMYWLVRARKGVDAKLLQYLTGWNEAEVQENIDLARSLAIVKFRQKTGQLFLHDEVYDWVDQFFQNDPGFVRSIEPLTEYYRQLGASLGLESDVLVARLYYELRLDPKRGYHECYARWDDEAIVRHNVVLDMRLRDEMLHFLHRFTESELRDPAVVNRIDRDDIDRDCAGRWVRRYLHRGQYQKAKEVAQTLRDSIDPLFKWDTVDDPVYKSGLLVTWGEALLSTGEPENQVRDVLREAIDLLRGQQHLDEYNQWWQFRVLGQAYYLTGRMHHQQGRFKRALLFNSEAIKIFRHQSEEQSPLLSLALAQQAYSLARLGRISQALLDVNEAMTLLGSDSRDRYPRSVALFVRSLVRLVDNQPMQAIDEAGESLSIAKALGEERLAALALLGLGQAYLAFSRQQAAEEISDYEQAEQVLAAAAEIFANFTDNFNLFEVRVAQAQLKLHQALQAKTLSESYQAAELFETARTTMLDTATRAGSHWPLQRAQCLALAVEILLAAGNLDAARQQITASRAVIPAEYYLEGEAEFKQLKEPVDEYWRILGRLEQAEARLVLMHDFADVSFYPDITPPLNVPDTNGAQATIHQAFEHYSKAMAYMVAFSNEPAIYNKIYPEIYGLLKALSQPQQLALQNTLAELTNRYSTIDLSFLWQYVASIMGNTSENDELFL